MAYSIYEGTLNQEVEFIVVLLTFEVTPEHFTLTILTLWTSRQKVTHWSEITELDLLNSANISDSFVGVVAPHLIVKVVYSGYTNKNQSIEVELPRRVSKCPKTDVRKFFFEKSRKVEGKIDWQSRIVESERLHMNHDTSPDKILKSRKNKIKLIDVDTVQQYMSRVPSHYGEF